MDLIPDDHPDRPVLLSNLGVVLGRQYERTKEAYDLDQAIEIATQAVDSTHYNRLRQVVCLINLSNRLESRYERTEDTSDLNKAIEVTRRVIDLIPPNDIDRANYLRDLGKWLSRRYERNGELSDLEQAIKVAKEAVDSAPDNCADRAHFLVIFSGTLKLRYERKGELDDLEQAIETARQAVESTSHDHPEWAGMACNLSNAYRNRYKRTRERRDLERAVEVAKQAVNSIPDKNPDRVTCLIAFSIALSNIYDRTEEMSDLEEAVEAAKEAVGLTAGNHLRRAGSLANLGNKLEKQYERTGDTIYLEQAIEAARQAVDSTPYNHPNRAGRLNNLGNKLEKRYKQTKDMTYLEQAIEAANEAADSIPYDHPDRAACLNNLGIKFESRYEREGEMSDLDSASAKLQEATNSCNAFPFARITAAARSLKLLAKQKRVGDGIRIGEIALGLVPTVYTRVLDRVDQQFVLSAFAGVASDLCAFYLLEGRLCDALQCLERGRAVITSQLLNDRGDMSSLSQDYPTLAKRYQSLVCEINSSFQRRDENMDKQYSAKRRREAAAELDICLKDIRAVPGYGRFLLGQTVTEMQQSAGEGYIVAVNVTDFQSDAIIVSSRSLETITLPGLSATKTREWLSKSWVTKKKSEWRRINDEFLKYLSWLWYTCVKHILEHIPASLPQSSQGLPRVWWIGCGLATSLPFHAAGLHSRGSDENTYSKVVSSYTASVKALSYARLQARRAEQDRTTDTVMAIATMLTTPKLHSDLAAPRRLPGSLAEKDEILKVASAGIRTHVLSYPSAEQVLNILERSRFAHFACHGTSNSIDPSNSGLILQKTRPDGRPEQDFLSVYRISQLQLRYAQIAYLSACSTAENKVAELLDEVVHVVSGFQVAGFPHVVGCLWQAGDSECVAVAREFYSSIFRHAQLALQNGEVASALQEAVMLVRAADLSMPLNWAQFVHFGA